MNTSDFPPVKIKMAESRSGSGHQLFHSATRLANKCDWNQAPGCQRETPQIKGKAQQIEKKSSFRFNCLAAGAAKQKQLTSTG